ncbi:hypothetical protein [Xylocopilactobacillus apis]|uniref:hypothetical protein n=1 Tax=Xylocopilactobacillus apis TaxID=2932183 RepID=UPI00295330AA|nr:hypothetical protein [Xylocopilactobacillus apis]
MTYVLYKKKLKNFEEDDEDDFDTYPYESYLTGTYLPKKPKIFYYKDPHDVLEHPFFVVYLAYAHEDGYISAWNGLTLDTTLKEFEKVARTKEDEVKDFEKKPLRTLQKFINDGLEKGYYVIVI